MIYYLNREIPLTDGQPPPDPDAPSWIHICPHGRFPLARGASAGPVVQVIDHRACTAMANALPPGDKLLIDYDHESYRTDRRTTAAGWITALEARNDGLWARVDWTPTGKTAVANREYRYLSPTWLPAHCEAIGTDILRPMRLDSVALTNWPNIGGAHPLTNNTITTNTNTTTTMTDYKQKLLDLLGLPAEATDEQIDAAIATRQTADTTAQEEKTALENRLAAAYGELNKTALDGAGITDPAERKSWEAMLNSETREHALLALQAREKLLSQTRDARERGTAQPLTNRYPPTPPTHSPADGTGTEDAAAAENRRAAAIRNRASEIAKNEGVPFSVAFNRAAKEL